MINANTTQNPRHFLLLRCPIFLLVDEENKQFGKKGKKRWDKRIKCYEGVGMNGSKIKGVICSDKREKRFKREIREE
jgi:hypothetical protein